VKWHRISEIHVLAAVLAAVFAAMWALSPQRFLGADNLRSMAAQLPEIGLLSLAMMLAMLSGGIDLSVVAVANLAGIVTALALQRWVGVDPAVTALWETAAALGAGLLAALVAGAANGCLIACVGVSPILATLGMMTLIDGTALVLTGGSAVSGVAQIAPIGHELLFGVPVPLWIFAACAAAAAVLLNRTAWGFQLYMLGANPIATLFSGVSNRRVVLRVYCLSALLAGVAGIIMTSRFNSAKAGQGASYLLVTILAAVLGGTSATGGFGRVSGLVLALAILQVLASGFNLLGVSPFLTPVIWGVTIFAVMALNHLVAHLSRRR